MKYKELINFEPITEVVKFSRTDENAYQETLVKTFVFSKAYKENLIPLMIRNLDYNQAGESFGLQVVGNYGTGKSHLMSLVSLIAEDKNLLDLVNDEKPKNDLSAIAGKFKVFRFELGNTESLWEVITYKFENYLESIGVNFSFDGHGAKTYFEKISLMMAAFEAKYPDKGFLVVIDEMLAYLKARSTPDKLNQDLQVLQALGQACDASKFKFIFGVQEMIYQSPEFQFAAEMLNKVNDRYKDIMITKEDVAFIVKNRLLQKDEHQKQKIRNHLDPFLNLFTDMHGRTEEYVELFPVHPTYFENFERIRIGKSQREILKTLSNQFSNLLNEEVPSDNPGLLTYDRYWQDIQSSQDLMAIPDVRRVKEITDTINDKIEGYFTGARASKKDVAQRITNACAIKLLQHEINKQNGSNAELLVDDLCLTNKLADNREFLVDIIESTADQIISATSGQYFDKDPENGEYHLRIEGGINFDQKIKEFASQMSDGNKDECFFKFLEVNLPLDFDPYRTGFRIWQHSIDWKSHKTYRDGYIFFGNPNEKSTTHPHQHFYMYFMPIFDDAKKQRNNETDEVYFVMDDLSEEFKQAVALYGAAQALEVRADSSQKAIYKQKIDELNKRARNFFNAEYVQVTKVIYKGNALPLSGYNLPGQGASKEQVFSDVASQVLEDWFEEERPDYPKFTQLNTSVAKENYIRMIKQALTKIKNPAQANRDGEGILSGLGLWVPGSLNYDHSPYAKSLLKQLEDKGAGKVLNRDEILEYIDRSDNLWITKDFQIEAEYEFVVMSALAAMGEVEITLQSGTGINSTNLHLLDNIEKEDFYGFNHIKRPKGINRAVLKVLFMGLLGRDLSNQLKDPGTYTALVGEAEKNARKSAELIHRIQGGVIDHGLEIISPEQALRYHSQLTAFKGLCDKLSTYNSEAKLKNFQFEADELKRVLGAKSILEQIGKQFDEIKKFREGISYLQQAKQYVYDQNFLQEITTVVNALPEVLRTDNDKEKEDFEKTIAILKEKYASYYLKAYLEQTISESDHTKKIALLDSEEMKLCESLSQASFLSTGHFHELVEKIRNLKKADPMVTKETILDIPYHDFNPVDYQNKKAPNIKDLKSALQELYAQWEQNMIDVLDDPIIKKNLEFLDPDQSRLIADFKAGKIGIEKTNVITIRDAIEELHNGIDKIEINTSDLKIMFNRPFNPDEAIEQFRNHIEKLSKGKERDKIRIIIK
jgi:hypothetical protein